MERKGEPPKLIINLVLRELRQVVKGQFDVDNATKVIDTIKSAKQSCLLGPNLFNFLMEAVIETWRFGTDMDHEPCIFRNKVDFEQAARSTTHCVGEELRSETQSMRTTPQLYLPPEMTSST